MSEEKFVKVSGTGSFLPGKPIPFDIIEDYLGHITGASSKNLKWMKRTKSIMNEMLDIDYVYYAIDPETKEFSEDLITMSVKSATKALEAANVKPEDIDFITVGSPLMEQIPPITTRIQEALGIESCSEMAIHSNCTSAYKAFMAAYDMIRIGRYKKALVIASSMNSSMLRADFYNQALLTTEDIFLRWFLCDGSGAMVLEASDTKTDGLFIDNIYNESVGGKKPSAMHNGFPAHFVNLREAFDKGYHHVSQMFKLELTQNMQDENGNTLFTNGLARMVDKYDIDLSRVRFFNINMPAKHVVENILQECEATLGLSRDIVYTKISKMGYAGPPAAFIALDKIYREEKLNKGDLILSFVTEVSKFMQAGFTLSYQ
ncbi:MAG: 3-oxoacyl-ACP synthase [Nitrospirota bacterium]